MGMNRTSFNSRQSAADSGSGWNIDGVLADIPAIIGRTDMGQKLIERADEVAKNIVGEKRDEVTTSQIRNIFGPVRQIQLIWKGSENATVGLRKVTLLRPKIAYQSKRVNKPGFRSLERVLDKAIEEIGKGQTVAEQTERFRRFVEFFEAIVAYHTRYAKV